VIEVELLADGLGEVVGRGASERPDQRLEVTAVVLGFVCLQVERQRRTRDEVTAALLVEVAVVGGEPACEKHLILGLDVAVEPVVLPVDVDERVVAARRGHAGGAKQPVRQRLAERARVLHVVVECQALQPEQALPAHELIELQPEGGLVVELAEAGLSLEPHADRLERLIAIAQSADGVFVRALFEPLQRTQRQLEVQAHQVLGGKELVARVIESADHILRFGIGRRRRCAGWSERAGDEQGQREQP
jgi:hypothetical protein